MLTNVTINGFKGLNEKSYELGQDTIITGRNGAGKSRIIESIIYGFTGLVNGYTKRLKNCSVSIESPGFSMLNLNGKKTGYNIEDVNLFLSATVPGYINSFTIEEKISIIARSNNLYNDFTPENNAIHKEKAAKYKKLKAISDRYLDEMTDNNNALVDLGDFNDVDDFITLKERYDAMVANKRQMEVYDAKKIEHYQRKQRLDEIKKELGDFTEDTELYGLREQNTKQLQGHEEIKQIQDEIKHLESGKCSNCGGDYTNDERLGHLEDRLPAYEYLPNLKSVQKTAKELDKLIEEFEMKLELHKEATKLGTYIEPAKPMSLGYTDEQVEDTRIKLANYSELNSKMERKKLLLDRNKALGEKLQQIEIDRLAQDVNDYVERRKGFYQSIEESVNEQFDFDVELFQENTTTDGGKLVFNVSKDGVDYFWLSSGEKLLIDATISTYLARNTPYDFLLIDNGERLDQANMPKLLEIAGSKQVIITRVASGGLSLEID